MVTRAAYILFYQRKSSEQVMDISDPGHWIHKLGQVTYQPSRVPPVSKSHEDLLDGGGKGLRPKRRQGLREGHVASAMKVVRYEEWCLGGGAGKLWMMHLPRRSNGEITFL